jgi:hypothetical protein
MVQVVVFLAIFCVGRYWSTVNLLILGLVDNNDSTADMATTIVGGGREGEEGEGEGEWARSYSARRTTTRHGLT